jgi:hypothetical protein
MSGVKRKSQRKIAKESTTLKSHWQSTGGESNTEWTTNKDLEE